MGAGTAKERRNKACRGSACKREYLQTSVGGRHAGTPSEKVMAVVEDVRRELERYGVISGPEGIALPLGTEKSAEPHLPVQSAQAHPAVVIRSMDVNGTAAALK